jgi:hypothetical protein
VDGDADDLELLVASTAQEVTALREDPRLQPATGSRGEALRTHTLDLLDAVGHRLKQRPEADAPAPVREAFARSLRQSVVMLRGAHAALPWLDATRAPDVNLGSLYLTEDCAQALIGTNVDLVVVPNSEFMYSTTSWPFEAVIGETQGFTPATTRRPIVLNYPLTDSDRLLLHALFAHELGHSAVAEYRLVEQVEDALDADPEFSAAFEETVARLASLWPGSYPTRINGTLRAWMRSWVEEFLCDHLAVEATGPSFMCAFGVFVLPLTYGEPGAVHPPNTVRVRLILEHLTKRGWRSYLETAIPGVTAWLDRVASDAMAPLPVPFDFLRDELTRRADVLRESAAARVGEDAIDVESTVTGAQEAARLLRHLILPSGLDEALESRAILLGAWQHALEQHGDGPQGLVRALGDTRLQQLVGKAIEMSTVRSAWKAAAQ